MISHHAPGVITQVGTAICLVAGAGAGHAKALETFDSAGLSSGGNAAVSAAVDGATLRLADGRVVRLAGILAPRREPTLARAARQALSALADGRAVTLWFDARRRDRYGRYVAHVTTRAGVWLQGALLERGLGRLYTDADNHALVAAMLRVEAAARAARRGLWADPRYAVRTPETASGGIGSYQIVEGKVLSVGRRRRVTYLNFGRVWRRDFTVMLDGPARQRFRAARIDPARYTGKRVRVRGWVFEQGGPAIQVSHPAQIEPID